MRDVVVVRPLKGVFHVKCPLCNVEKNIDKTDGMASTAIEHCEGCGAIYNFQLLAIRPLRDAIDDESLKDDDITLMMSKKPDEEIKEAPIVIGTQKLTIEKSVFYAGEIDCPFCNEQCVVRYNAIVPHSAQWCPTKTCKTELVITISAAQIVGGDVSSWYNKNETEPEGGE